MSLHEEYKRVIERKFDEQYQGKYEVRQIGIQKQVYSGYDEIIVVAEEKETGIMRAFKAIYCDELDISPFIIVPERGGKQ